MRAGLEEQESRLCAICSAPLDSAEVSSLHPYFMCQRLPSTHPLLVQAHESNGGERSIATASCRSCQQQIMGMFPSSTEPQASTQISAAVQQLLPHAMLTNRHSHLDDQHETGVVTNERMRIDHMRAQLQGCLLDDSEE